MFRINSATKKRFDSLDLDDVRFTISYQGRASRELTSVEFRILACFARHSGRALKKSELLESIWGDTLVHAKTVNVHFSHLRRKLKEIGVDIIHEGKSCFRILPAAQTKPASEEMLGAG
jgi:DNA-binding response OmpR family regulator